MKEGISDIVWAVNPSNDSFKTMMEKLKLYASGITKAAGISFEFGMQEGNNPCTENWICRKEEIFI